MAITRLNNNSITSVTALPSAIATGKVLQYQYAEFNNSGTSITTSNLVATNITDSITPTSASNKILVSISFHTRIEGYTTGTNDYFIQADGTIYRNDSVKLFNEREVVSTSGRTTQSYYYGHTGGQFNFTYLDSPATTSATSYKLYLDSSYLACQSAKTMYDGFSSITLMEVSV